MGSFFKKPKKPKADQEQKELVRKQKERINEQESELAERKAAKRRGDKGRGSLITGAETGHTGTPTRTTTG